MSENDQSGQQPGTQGGPYGAESGGQSWDGGQYGQQPPTAAFGQGDNYGPPPAPPGSYGGYPPQGGGGYGYSAPQPTPDNSRNVGFFGALFDFTFTHFVTPMIVKVVFVIATVLIGIGLLIAIIGGFAAMKAGGILVLIVGPIVALFYLALIRMTLEFYLSIVRMSEDVHRRKDLRV